MLMVGPETSRMVATDLASLLRAAGLSPDEEHVHALLVRRADRLSRAMGWTPEQAWDYLAEQGIADIALLMTTA